MAVVRRVLCVLVLIALPSTGWGQELFVVSGRVVAADSQAPLAGVAVVSGDRRTVTSASGDFVLRLPAGTQRVAVSAAGYADQEVAVDVSAGLRAITVALVRPQQVREELTVSADLLGAQPAPATLALSPGTVLRVAGAADNIFKALQTLPGISATDDFGSRLAVRGGGPDQNLTVMDGVEIHNPYRLFGLTSAFNPETVARFELTAGGFGAEYGDRLSSILLVENRAGTAREAFAGSMSLSFTDANVVLEGRLPGGRPVPGW